MSQIELDMAKPVSADAASDYYRNNMKKILNSVSTSTINSDHIKEEYEIPHYCSSSTASDSELEDNIPVNEKFANRQVHTVISNIQNIEKVEQTSCKADTDLHSRLQNINTVSINNSNDVHIGNKTFFNGPVTIKNIISSNNADSSSILGITNQGFEGSRDNLEKNDPKKLEEIKKDEKQTNRFASQILRKKNILYLMTGCTIFLTIIFIVMICIQQLYRYKEDRAHEFKIISRKEWNAKEVHDPIEDLEVPLSRIIICHTVTSKCDTKEECPETVKGIQDLHTGPDFNFSDIGYNFLIGGDGNVYEGRGWYKQGAHTSGYNRGSLGIAYIGNFVEKLPNDKQISVGFKIFAEGLKLGVLTNDYVIYGASQLRDTESPGRTFLELIKTWSHAFKNS